MNELFDDKLRGRLRQYSEEPDERLWDSLTARIEEENRANRIGKRIRHGWIFLFGVIIVGGFYTMVDSIPNENSSFAQKAEQNSMDLVPLHIEATPKIILPPLSQTNSNPKATSGTSLTKLTPSEEVVNLQTDNTEALPIHELSEIQNIPIEVSGVSIGQIVEDRIANTEEVNKPVSNDSITITRRLNNEKKEIKPNNENEKKKKHPFSIYFTIMPTLGYQRIESNSSDNLFIESIDRISTFSPDRLGVRAELGVEDPIANRVNLFSGLVYFQRKQTIGYTERQIDNTEISQGPDGKIEVKRDYIDVHKTFEYEVRNLGLQVGISYQLSKKTFLQTAGAGIEFHVALNKLQQHDQAPEFTNNPSVYVFYNLYYRIQYPTDTKLKAVMQPTLNYSLYINQNMNAPFYVKPYGLGLNLGFTYNF